MRTELVTTLKREATEIIADLERDHEPVLITQHGRPAAYLIDVDSFEALNQRIAVLEGIARAEHAIDQGGSGDRQLCFYASCFTELIDLDRDATALGAEQAQGRYSSGSVRRSFSLSSRLRISGAPFNWHRRPRWLVM